MFRARVALSTALQRLSAVNLPYRIAAPVWPPSAHACRGTYMPIAHGSSFNFARSIRPIHRERLSSSILRALCRVLQDHPHLCYSSTSDTGPMNQPHLTSLES